ncbi:MAG TPA: SOS response-associated peptidase [Candidatus Krumholzibacteria bacterium]|nr:SOS response-associated peptidase [Candidatus Krumholzibacteria bacterium]HPD72615.1 SOS response-associated peptidase [Candidatus Krumholzibacteria bacterium]HRY40453.1 SOS response-associated peptidase [Candidatus Krumholzibacteria bacterium]
MCGRIVLKAPASQVAAELELEQVPELVPRYNIAPTQPVLAVRADTGGRRVADFLGWGVVPPWSSDARIGGRLFNARSETVATTPAFRDAFARRRCLVPVDGFYEWLREGRSRQPFYFSAASQRLLALAGVWERWTDPSGRVLETCSVLTTGANRLVGRVHDRMPVILAPESHGEWLAATPERAAGLAALLAPAGEDLLRAWPVSPRVGRSSAEGPDLIAPLRDERSGQLPLF